MSGDDATTAVIDALEAAGVEYMLVGSLSSNFYGIPRATQDADFVVHLGSTSITQFAARLGSAFKLDPQGSFETTAVTERYLLYVSGSTFKLAPRSKNERGTIWLK